VVVVNTRQNRSSAIGFGLAALVVLPAPNGSVTLADRQQVTAAYAGIAAGVLANYDFVEFVDFSIAMAGLADVSIAMAGLVDVTVEPD
jgi:hypothetical protein